MNIVKFYVEDVAHRELVLVLTKVSKKQVRYKDMNKTEVLKKLREESEEHIVGVVDEDPDKTQPPLLRNFEEFANDERANIRILRLNEAKLIILRPRFEEWILKVARNSRLDVKKYGLPEDADKLHECLKPKRLRGQKIYKKFREFLGDLIDCHELRTFLSFLQDC
ncbi:MAG: hypothetical protein N2V73_00255 [Candidatus Methanospirare jalkutatii]|nr:hypothetical protein [Candidatus Methanospirare jalkutatii]MCW7079510.1 hypothetical protein [Candidatus Methanospirare jalkutatii]